MQIQNTPTYKDKSFKGFYDITTRVQENTLLNRGLIDIGGCALPQAIMSNNKDEAIERGSMSLLYFFMSIVTPFFMLPVLNKHFLNSQGIVKNAKNLEKNIVKVSKEYLTKDSDYLVKGIKETGIMLDAQDAVKAAKKNKIATTLEEELQKIKDGGLKLDNQKAFDNILKQFEGKENQLREKLIKFHEKVFKTDFLLTSWMWCSAPYIATEITERRTNKKGFSASFDMVDQSKYDPEKYKKDKQKKLLASAVIATVPALIFPKILMKNLTGKSQGLKKYASAFDYSEGMFMSKAIFATMWALCDYPSALIASRDKAELKDRAIRFGALFAMFFGGDFAINNLGGRILDKFAGTKIMKRPEGTQELKGANRFKQFFKDFKLLPRGFSEMNKMKAAPELIAKTKKYGAALYWFSLIANMGLIGFALPAGLNRMLKKSLQKENSTKTSTNTKSQDDKQLIPLENKKAFAGFGF